MPPSKVFISYNHEDEAWLKRLVTHLGVSAEDLDLWDDRCIEIGADWLAKIQKALDEADAAVLLISAPFLRSKFIKEVEVPRLLERRNQEGLRLFPILVRPCDWERISWLASLQIRPAGVKSLSELRGPARESGMVAIVKEIRALIGQPATPLPSPAPSALEEETALTSLHQLPSPPPDFIGRVDELAGLRQAIEHSGVRISGLRGMGGVGKTTLALKLAEDLKPTFPDAQIYLDLKGVAPEPLSPFQAMAHVIRSFHPDARLPDTPEELAGLYRSVLDGNRALLLMDNAANREQVEPLTPPRGCLLLVTSRLRFALPGLVAKDLDELSPEEARDLLLRIEPRIGESATEIARLCGNLPIAIRLAGGALCERPDISPGEYARRLTDTQKRSKLVDASLSLSYELLSDDLRKQWRELAVFPGSFDAAGAAVVWAVKPEPAEEGLGTMVKSCLVDAENGRYKLHDLARVFAESRMTETEAMEARRRHAERYAEVLAAADGLYEEGGESVLKGLRLYDLEWVNIQAGQAWAAERAEADEMAARLCSRYPDAGVYCLYLRQPKRERIRWLECAILAAQHLEDRSAEGRHLGNLGRAYWGLGDARRAIELYEQRLQIAREIGDRRGEGGALGKLGLAYADLGNARRAIELFEQQLQIAREISDRRGEGDALGNLAYAYATYADIGDAHRAIELCEEQLPITREIGDRYGESDALGNLGLASAALGDARRAIQFHEQALTLSREIGDRRGESQDLGNLGNAYADLGDARRAIEFYKQALQIARENNDRQSEAFASWYLGLQYEAEGNLERAAELMQVKVDYTREIVHQDAEKWAARIETIRARIRETQGPPKKPSRKRRSRPPSWPPS